MQKKIDPYKNENKKNIKFKLNKSITREVIM